MVSDCLMVKDCAYTAVVLKTGLGERLSLTVVPVFKQSEG
jgi:hypothetical protein